MWIHENAKMKVTFVKNRSSLCDLKDTFYKSLGLDPQQWDRDLKFFFPLNVPNVLRCLCGSDREVAIFIEMLITNPPFYRSPFYIDRF